MGRFTYMNSSQIILHLPQYAEAVVENSQVDMTAEAVTTILTNVA